MALQFPTTPSINETYQTGSSATYKYNGVYWDTVSPPTQVFTTSLSSSYAVQATSSSYAQTSDYSTAQSAIFRTDVGTTNGQPLLWETTYNSIPSSVVEVSNITGTINVKQGHTLKISFGLGYNNSTAYRGAALYVFDGANWNYYDNDIFQAAVTSGGGSNWDSGTSITRVLTAPPNANQAYRVYADGAPVNTGAWLDLTRLE